jgi:hypothetical protein
MAKQAYVYSGSDWVPLASEVTNLSNYYTKGEIDIIDAPTGLKKVVPSSVAVGSGSGSVSASGTVTFSGASSVSLNDVFSSTYDNYVIFYKNTTTSTGNVLTLRYRLSGTDTSANYGTQRLYAQGTTVTASRDGVGTDEIFVSDLNNATPSFAGYQMNIFTPNVASPTVSFISGTTYIGADLYPSFSAGFQNSTTQFTGFTLLVNTGTFGGTVSVFGVNK